jgi:hypothetical protein
MMPLVTTYWSVVLNLSSLNITRGYIRSDLDTEWDVERSVQLKASLIALGEVALGVSLGKKWLMIPAAICSFFAVQAIQGGAIPVSGNFRTRKQIAEEQFGLKELLTKGAYKNLDSNNF